MKPNLLLAAFILCWINTFPQSSDLNSLYSRKVAAFNQGDYLQALTWSQKAEEKAKAEFGETEMYANYASDLAQLYYQLERYEEARSIFEKVEVIYSEKLGANHTYTAVINNNLGNLYRLIGQNNLALNAYTKALSGYEVSLGPDNEYYKMTLNSIIDLCNTHEFYPALEDIYRKQRVFAARKGNASHEYVAWSNNLAMILEQNGKYEESEKIYFECIDIATKNKATFSSELPTLYGNLGDLYLKQNKLDDAERAISRALDPSHESYAIQLNNLAMVFDRKHKYTEAIKTYEKSLAHLTTHSQDTTTTYKSVVYNTIALMLNMGKYPEAIQVIRKTLSKLQTPDLRLVNELGIAFERSGFYTRADSVYKTVLNYTKDQPGFSKKEHYRAMAARGEVLRIQGKLDEAEKSMIESLEALKQDSINEKESIITLHHNLGYLYKSKGQYTKAEAFMRKAISQRQNFFGKDMEYAGMIKNLGSLYMDMIQYERAEKLITEAMTIEQKLMGEKTDAYSTSLNQLGLAYFYQGRYSESKKCIEQSMDIKALVLGNQHEFYANGLVNLANIYMEEGAFENAEPLYKNAETIYRKSSGTNTMNYANILHALAKVKAAMGMYLQSEELFIKALNILATVLGTNHPDYANTLNSLGMLYAQMNQFDRADSAYALSLEISKTNGGTRTYQYAQTSNNIAQMYLFADRAKDALTIYIECLKIAEETIGTEHPDYATFLNNIGQAHFKLNEFDLARDYFAKTVSRREKIYGQSHLSTLEAKSNLLSALDALGQRKEAEKIYRLLNEEYLNYINQKFPYLTEKEKSSFYQTVNYHFESFQSFALKYQKENPSIIGQMYDLQLATKAIILNASRKVRENILTSSDSTLKENYTNWLTKREYLAKLYSLPETEIKQRGIDLNQLQSQADSLERILTKRSEVFAKNYQRENISWKDIRKKLKAGEAAIEMTRFYLFDKQWIDSVLYAALIVKPESEYPELVILPEGKKMESRFLKYYKGTIRAKIDDKASWINYWSPIQQHLKGTTKIYFAPDGVYNEINLNTLHDTTNTAVIDKFAIHLLTSTKEIVSTQSNQKQTKNERSLLVGRPAYRLNFSTKSDKSNAMRDVPANRTSRLIGGSSFNDLPGTQKEVEQIASILSKSVRVETLLAEQAREENIKKSQDAAILHIATHGFFLSSPANEFDQLTSKRDQLDDPMLRSGIILAGVEDFLVSVTSDDKTDDGVLTAMEVCNLMLENTDLVVLSACETGLGEVRYGEGVYGLQRAFRIAGAKSMIMSLWKVDDQATQEMMITFYKNWITHQDKRKAFLQAQQEIRSKYKYPYYWGAFILVGE